MAVERSPLDHVSLRSLLLKGRLFSDGVEAVMLQGESVRQKKSRCVINKVG